MKWKLSFAAASAFVLVAVGPAAAADLAVKARPVAPDPGYNWSGFYVGGNLGAVGSTGKEVHQCISPVGGLGGLGCTVIPDQSLSGTGVIGGGQVGYNWQVRQWVFGVEADGQATSLKTSSVLVGSFPQGGFAPTPADTISAASLKLDWLATVRGRIGVTAGSALFYVTGGAAFGGVQTSYSVSSATAGIAYPSSTNTARAGWTAGGGVEWGFAPRWSAKFEGLYYDLGSVTSLGGSVPPVTAVQLGGKFEVTGWVAKAGINYHFAAPVVAKY